MKKLLNYGNQQEIISLSLTLDRQTSEDFKIFTCSNLKRAKIILRQILRFTRKDSNSYKVPTYVPIED